jgi:ABC-type amino acid transport substrate-binding protein
MKIFFILLFLMLNLFSKETHFKISYDANYAPFSYKEDGKEVGLLIDIWKLWAKNNNYTIEFVEGLLWENAINLAKENKVDYFLGQTLMKSGCKLLISFMRQKQSILI